MYNKREKYFCAEKPKVDLSKYSIGDYVNYTYDAVSSGYTTKSTENGYGKQTIPQTSGLKWRILNIDEASGTIDLVSENPTSNTVTFRGALGYHNGPYIMNAICEAQYSNSALNVKARNISLLDMEKQLTTAGKAASALSSSNYYWVSGCYVDTDSSYAGFGLRYAYTYMNGYGTFFSDHDSYDNNYHLRPVVSLPSSILSDTKDASGAWNLTK